MYSASPTRTNYGRLLPDLPTVETRAITRRESHHRRLRKKELTRGHVRRKVQPCSAAPSPCCLLSVSPPPVLPSSSHALSSLFDGTRCIQPLAASIPESSINAASSHVWKSLLLIADINPDTANVAIGITGPFLSAFGFLFILRIVMSWYPKLPVGKFPYVLAYAPTEPFLRITRKVIPPLGGVDVTPVVWFGLVSFLNEILVGPQGLLVLLSQKI